MISRLYTRNPYIHSTNTLLRGPAEPGQYMSLNYTQALDDHWVLASIGTVGDAYDDALAESFIDSFKTELIADRAGRTRSQLELAVVEYIGWFNTSRLHSSLGYRNPDEAKPGWLELGYKRGLARTAPTLADVQLLAAGLSAS